jgi:hypothetical protein
MKPSRVSTGRSFVIESEKWGKIEYRYAIEADVPQGMTAEEAIKDLDALLERVVQEKLGESKPCEVTQSKTEAQRLLAELLPIEVQAKAAIETVENTHHIKIPYGAVTTEQFAEITRRIESIGGRWVRAGKDSRWEIPLKH